MTEKELCEAFAAGRIEKRLFWQLMREKNLPLVELRELLALLPEGTRVEVDAEEVVLTFEGIRFAFDFSQTFCRAESVLAMRGNPEQADFDFLGSLLGDDDVVFDIGANVGVVSLSLLHRQPRLGRIYAFEPLPPTFAHLRHNLALNGTPEKIVPVNAGMGSELGSFDFYLPGADEAASLQPNLDAFYLQESVDGHYSGKQKMEKIACRVETLDHFVSERGIQRVDLMKIDVEGNEKFVLEGGADVLEKYRPLVYAELLRKHAKRFGYHPNEVLRMMEGLGYRCFTFTEGHLCPFAEMTEETEETNFFFLHEQRHADILQAHVGQS